MGGNLSMKGGGNEGRKLLRGKKGCLSHRRKASTRSVKFTMIGFRALTSDSVMCVLIFEGKKLNCAIKNDFNINMKTDMEQHLIHTL